MASTTVLFILTHTVDPNSFVICNGPRWIAKIIRYKFPDDNAFVTMFIVHALVEASEYISLDVVDTEINMAIEAISLHQDRNMRGKSGLISFWNQLEDSDGHFSARFSCQHNF